MKQKEIEDFIYFLTNSKNLTKAQRHKRDQLLANVCVSLSKRPQPRDSDSVENTQEEDTQQKTESETKAETTNAPVEENKVYNKDKHRNGIDSKYISPKNIQSFLREFNQDGVLKYTCHIIDYKEVREDICKECSTEEYDFFKHFELICKRFDDLRQTYKKQEIYLSPNIISLISVYLTGKDLNGKKEKWSANEIEYGWGCNSIIEWAKQHPHIIPNPGKNIAISQKNSGFILPSTFWSETTGDRILDFSNLVIFFKSQFHIRQDNSLRTILTYTNNRIWTKSNVNILFSTNNFNDGVELFTDVDKLLQAYNKIIRICIDNSDSSEPVQIELSFYDDLNNNRTFFEIHHKNSCYKKSLKNSIERIGESQAQLIKNQINGLCDLYVESKFSDGKCARINLWDKLPKLDYEQVEEAIGVKYILVF